jgi:hypothetical protein
VEQIDHRRAVRSRGVPIDNADEPCAVREEVAMEEVTVDEPARHVGQNTVEVFGETVKRLRLVVANRGPNDGDLVPQRAFRTARGLRGMQGDKEVHTVLEQTALNGMPHVVTRKPLLE